MAESKTFAVDCTTDVNERSKGLALIQETFQQVSMRRLQFTASKVVNPDGSFVFTIETNGLPVGQAKPATKEPKADSAKTPKT